MAKHGGRIGATARAGHKGADLRAAGGAGCSGWGRAAWMAAALFGLLCLASSPARADVTVSGNLEIFAGGAGEVWHGGAEVASGSSSRAIYGLLDIVAAGGGAVCGDGVCDAGGGESCDVCAIDCGCTSCGNGTCDTGETPESCATDCNCGVGVAAGTVCRAASGACDQAEVCDGVSSECPADSFATGTVCRVAAGACDVAETCSGQSADCPADAFQPAGVVCDDHSFTTCSGSAAQCSADTLLADESVFDGQGSCAP